MPKFRQRPIEVDAVQWTGNNTDEVIAFITALPCPPSHTVSWGPDPGDGWITFDTPVGEAELRRGDWLVRSPADDLSMVKASAFPKGYEPVPPEGATVTIHIEPDPPRIAELIRALRRRP